MNGDLLLDSNIVIALFADETSVKARISKARSVYLPSIVLGELFYGAEKSAKVEENLGHVADLSASVAVLSCDAATARVYGRIKESLCAKGRPLPENDVWIASVALQYDLTLATRDHHFSEIPTLSIDPCR